MKQLTAILLCFSMLGCATIHRHPKLTAFVVATAIAVPVGIKLGYKPPCPSVVSGYPYNGTPPCPKSCDGPGDCYWPGKSK